MTKHLAQYITRTMIPKSNLPTPKLVNKLLHKIKRKIITS